MFSGVVLIVVERRWAGLVVLIVVALAAVTLPNLGGRRIAGSAVPAVIPGPPSAGDCVKALSPLPPADRDVPDGSPIIYPSAVYGDCTGTVLGEVMSVDVSIHPLVDATSGGYNRADAACSLDQVNYVGSIGPFDPATIKTPGIAWQAAAFVDSEAVGPDPVQRAAGRWWTACVGMTPGRNGYRGRIVNALSTGVLPPDFALCWKSLAISTDQQVDDQVTPCATPHPIEVLATTQIIDPTATPTQVNRSCIGFASRAMRTADPTRGGTVVIAAYSMDGASVLPLTSRALLAGYVGCIAAVTPPHRLVGTLVGLGDRPAPTTG